MVQTKRRHLVLATGGLIAVPSTLLARQPDRVRRVGIPLIPPLAAMRGVVADKGFGAFENGMRVLGYTLDQDLVVDYRSAEGNRERLPQIVQEVLRGKPDVIVTAFNSVTSAVKAATQTVPVVMVLGTDVVRSGLVQSLARPGGNITGLTWDVGDEFRAKRLELLKEMQLRISRMAVLWEPPKRHQAAIDMGASALGVETRWFQWSGDIARDLADIAQWRADVLYVYGSPRAVQRRVELNKLALQLRLPTAYPGAVFVEDGGLMSYGPNAPDLFRRAATYVDKILKGAKPVDLPVERPRQIDFVINLKTAKALGLTIPHSILLRADRVIE